MQSQITEEHTQLCPPVYPRLMYHIRGDFVILETRHKHGTVVHAGLGCAHDLGYETSTWAIQEFVPFTGVIALSND